MKQNTYHIILSVLIISGLGIWYAINPPQGQIKKQLPPGDNPPVVLDPSDPLKMPGLNASEADKKTHFEIVQQHGKEAEFLSIADCKGEPRVIKTTQNKDLLIRNSDPMPHEIQINPGHTYKVPGQGSLVVKANFGYGPGVYGYGCDNSPEARGIFWVLPE